MADIVPTLLTEGTSESDSGSYATASITPSALTLVLAWINQVGQAASSVGLPTLAGNGIIWTQVATQSYFSEDPDRGRITIFAGAAVSPTTGVLTFTMAETQARVSWGVVEFANAAIAGSIVQAIVGKKDPADGDADTPSVTLAAFNDVLNSTFGVIGVGFPDVSVTVGNGFTEINNITVGGNGSRNQSQFKVAPDTVVDWTLGALGTESGFCGMEIKNQSQSAAAGVGLPSLVAVNLIEE